MSDVCIPNIGPHERKKRLWIGSVVLFVATAASLVLVFAPIERPWRLLAFLPFWAGATSLFQVYEKTCVALASRGTKNLDTAEERITDVRELAQVKRQARRVRLEGLAVAVLLTAMVLAIP
jgi:NADH:ubiquinone oxidoreductase subunit 6 (subunit J)